MKEVEDMIAEGGPCRVRYDGVHISGVHTNVPFDRERYTGGVISERCPVCGLHAPECKRTISTCHYKEVNMKTY